MACVLVVEDNPALRRVCARVLELAGFEVVTAGDGRRGLEIWHERSDDVALVLTDVDLPEMTGEAMARQMLAERPEQPILFVSGTARVEVLPLRPGQVAWLAKPFDAEELLASVGDLLGRTDAGSGAT